MPMTPKREKAILAASAICSVILIALLAYFAPDNDLENPSLSTYSVRSGGAKATFLLVKELSSSADRWTRPPSELPKNAEGVLLIIAQPVRFATAEEQSALSDFINRGGNVLFTATQLWTFLPNSRAIITIPPLKSWKQYKAMNSGPLTEGVPEITMDARFHWITDREDVILYGDQREPVAVAFRRGKGHIAWLGSPIPLTNIGLKGKGNAEFLANVLHEMGSRQVFWDTYFSEEKDGPHTAFSSKQVIVAASQLFLIFALVLWTHSLRFGPIRSFAEGEEPKSQLEFVRTLASLYRSANAANIALQIAYERFMFLLARHFGLPTSASLDQFAQALSSALSLPEEQVIQVLRQCDTARLNPELPAAEAEELLRTLQSYMRKLKIVPQITEERS